MQTHGVWKRLVERLCGKLQSSGIFLLDVQEIFGPLSEYRRIFVCIFHRSRGSLDRLKTTEDLNKAVVELDLSFTRATMIAAGQFQTKRCTEAWMSTCLHLRLRSRNKIFGCVFARFHWNSDSISPVIGCFEPPICVRLHLTNFIIHHLLFGF